MSVGIGVRLFDWTIYVCACVGGCVFGLTNIYIYIYCHLVRGGGGVAVPPDWWVGEEGNTLSHWSSDSEPFQMFISRWTLPI